MIIKITESFISHRTDKSKQYNQRGRTDRRFLMDLDAEIYEWDKLHFDEWRPHDSWMVDGYDEWDRKVDVKFIRKYWNVSREKTLNLIKQRDILDGYTFIEWVERPSRPLRAGDQVRVNELGFLSYGSVADGLRKSFKEPDGFYVDVRKLLQCKDT